MPPSCALTSFALLQVLSPQECRTQNTLTRQNEIALEKAFKLLSARQGNGELDRDDVYNTIRAAADLKVGREIGVTAGRYYSAGPLWGRAPCTLPGPAWGPLLPPPPDLLHPLLDSNTIPCACSFLPPLPSPAIASTPSPLSFLLSLAADVP